MNPVNSENPRQLWRLTQQHLIERIALDSIRRRPQ
jgi:hypothetical protein